MKRRGNLTEKVVPHETHLQRILLPYKELDHRFHLDNDIAAKSTFEGTINVSEVSQK